VKCKLGAFCYYLSSVLVDSFVLRNPPDRQARSRYQSVEKAIRTFNFALHTSLPFAKPKKPFIDNAHETFLIFANICQDNIIIMATQFGERIRELRTKQNLLLRQLASLLDVDTSIISKIERGDRQFKKEQIPLLAQILKTDVEELQTLWLADQIYAVVKDEKMANEAMQVAEKKINLKKRTK
jgi:transcriptional regulator with XRE-family HTH domain